MKKSLGARLKALFGIKTDLDGFLEEMEEILIESDVGPETAMEISSLLRERAKKERGSDREDWLAVLRGIVKPWIKAAELVAEPGRLNFFLVLGVNGVGKTTSIAKLGARFLKTPEAGGVVFAAGDTFRAAAIEQLCELGRRLGVRVVHQAIGADSGAVIYDAIDSARSKGETIVLADTAGRMHNRENLVKELGKVDKIVRSRIGDGVYKKILVIDATTGQNGLRQAETFHAAVGLDGVILTKYDSTAKGGIVISICRRLGLPFLFLGTGEKPDLLEPFDADRYLDDLLNPA